MSNTVQKIEFQNFREIVIHANWAFFVFVLSNHLERISKTKNSVSHEKYSVKSNGNFMKFMLIANMKNSVSS